MLAQDPPDEGPVAVLVPLQGPRAVVVEEPRPAQGVDRGQLVDRRVGALDVVRPVPLASGDLVVQRAQRLLLLSRGPVVHGHDEVAVALLVAGAECERALHVGAHEVVAEDPPPVADQLVEQLVEVCVRRDGHPVTVGGAMLAG